MKTKLVLISLLIAVFVIVGYSNGYSQALGSVKPKPGAKPPVITNFYAPEQVSYGDALKFYIAAEDPDGEMLRVAVIVNQLGRGAYFTDWTYLKPGDQKSFKGYLQWNTQSGTAILSENTRVTLRISVFDKAGLESNEVVIPLRISSFGVSYPSPPAPFDQQDVHRLGHINVNLVNPIRDNDHGKDSMFFLMP